MSGSSVFATSATLSRRFVFAALAVSLAMSGFSSSLNAQEVKKLPRIGVLWPGDVKQWNDGMFDTLRKHGFVDGVTVRIDVRNTYERFDLGPKLAEELVALNPAVIFVSPSAFAKDISRALKKARKKIPMVVASYDPVAEGVVASAAHPGGNITGVGGAYDTEIVGKHLQLIKDMIPRVSRVAYLYDKTWAEKQDWTQHVKRSLEKTGSQLGISIMSIEVTSSDQLEPAFSQAVRLRADAIVVTNLPLFNAPASRARIIQLAAQHHMPAIYFDELFAYEGGLISYWASVKELLARGGDVVAKILRGAKPSEIPIEYPTRIRLVVNLRTAKAMGLTIPESVLIQADEVIR